MKETRENVSIKREYNVFYSTTVRKIVVFLCMEKKYYETSIFDHHQHWESFKSKHGDKT